MADHRDGAAEHNGEEPDEDEHEPRDVREVVLQRVSPNHEDHAASHAHGEEPLVTNARAQAVQLHQETYFFQLSTVGSVQSNRIAAARRPNPAKKPSSAASATFPTSR